MFTISDSAVRHLKTVYTMIQDLGMNNGEALESIKSTPIPLPEVGSDSLRKLLEWCEYHKDDPIITDDPEKSKLPENIPEWDAEYLNIDSKEILALVHATNYLQVSGLFSLLVVKVANMVKKKSPEQVRDMFNITNDFTPEEEKQIQKENAWCKDYETNVSSSSE